MEIRKNHDIKRPAGGIKGICGIPQGLPIGRLNFTQNPLDENPIYQSE